ncbi:MAG: succinate dehydrogenase iron-sulfur subunit [Actinobacteria bacterium]|nr:succinate dehydrogenase iron-sulfur subunit [Actinomycetota bacterium]
MADTIRFRIRRQDHPDSGPYWQEFAIPYRREHNVVSALLAIRENPVTIDGERVAPPVWDSNCMEEVCGSCSLRVNGRARQACSALVDTLEQPIVLEPMLTFPVVRDLLVDRSAMFDNLRRVKAWIDIDGSWDIHTGAPRISPQEWDLNYALSRCMTCGCCMDACPHFGLDRDFIGPAPLAQVLLMNSHPTGKYSRADRLHAIMSDGGLTDCSSAQNCVRVCPKHVPLTAAIGKLGRQTTAQLLRDIFGG